MSSYAPASAVDSLHRPCVGGATTSGGFVRAKASTDPVSVERRMSSYPLRAGENLHRPCVGGARI